MTFLITLTVLLKNWNNIQLITNFVKSLIISLWKIVPSGRYCEPREGSEAHALSVWLFLLASGCALGIWVTHPSRGIGSKRRGRGRDWCLVHSETPWEVEENYSPSSWNLLTLFYVLGRQVYQRSSNCLISPRKLSVDRHRALAISHCTPWHVP